MSARRVDLTDPGTAKHWRAATVAARAGGVEVDVALDTAADAPHDAIDAEYHVKYDRYGPGPVGHVTGAASHPVTTRLLPVDPPNPTGAPT